MVDMGDDGHVTDVLFPVHKSPDLVYCEVHLQFRMKFKTKNENSDPFFLLFYFFTESKHKFQPSVSFTANGVFKKLN